MNPARSLGPAIVSWKFGNVWIYLIAPTVGAVGGALLFRALRLQHHPCGPDSSPNTTRLSDEDCGNSSGSGTNGGGGGGGGGSSGSDGAMVVAVVLMAWMVAVLIVVNL
ncbi:probable aquaporin NIP7-1 [Camellia sinensis]|uniref:probable aquaporin NIP7-1 n=1 Tax=Camellia sinensis TaxID=4442 RepID=UPI00103573EB|nr:probable aquaporin NIP7-1 [Camellia sinensis]